MRHSAIYSVSFLFYLFIYFGSFCFQENKILFLHPHLHLPHGVELTVTAKHFALHRTMSFAIIESDPFILF
jgi:hypothetical protein